MRIDTDALKAEAANLPHEDLREAVVTQIEIIEQHAASARFWIEESYARSRREAEVIDIREPVAPPVE